MVIRVIHVGVGGRGVWPLQAFVERDDFESVALVDIKPEALAAARQVTGLGEDRCFEDIDEAFRRVEADAVIVITPPQLHATQCMKAVKAGKHMLVEKPFTLSFEEARAIVRDADAQGVCVAVAQNARYTPAYATLARLVREEAYGKPAFGLMTKFSWRPNVHHSGKMRHSYLWERGIHDLDSLRSIFNDEPVWVWGHSFNPPWSPYQHGAGTYLWLEFEHGATCGCTCTFASHKSGESLRIDCKDASLELMGNGIEVRRPGAQESEVLPLDKVPVPESVLLDGWHQYITKGIEPPFGGHENLKTVALVEAAGIASDERRVVNLKQFWITGEA